MTASGHLQLPAPDVEDADRRCNIGFRRILLADAHQDELRATRPTPIRRRLRLVDAAGAPLRDRDGRPGGSPQARARPHRRRAEPRGADASDGPNDAVVNSELYIRLDGELTLTLVSPREQTSTLRAVLEHCFRHLRGARIPMIGLVDLPARLLLLVFGHAAPRSRG